MYRDNPNPLMTEIDGETDPLLLNPISSLPALLGYARTTIVSIQSVNDEANPFGFVTLRRRLLRSVYAAVPCRVPCVWEWMSQDNQSFLFTVNPHPSPSWVEKSKQRPIENG